MKNLKEISKDGLKDILQSAFKTLVLALLITIAGFFVLLYGSVSYQKMAAYKAILAEVQALQELAILHGCADDYLKKHKEEYNPPPYCFKKEIECSWRYEYTAFEKPDCSLEFIANLVNHSLGRLRLKLYSIDNNKYQAVFTHLATFTSVPTSQQVEELSALIRAANHFAVYEKGMADLYVQIFEPGAPQGGGVKE